MVQMKFPITRETLKEYNHAKAQAEKMAEEREAQYTQIITNLCKNFENQIQRHVHEKKYVWNNQGTDEYLIQKLKETFIGCDIIVDPLKTYVIIDWS
jgi:adenosyl cobinamide kinase/adenosyl cobinamide phosphate guanylyltransferase